MNRALIIRQPWIDLILSGEKTWEMRSTRTATRGRIGLIEQGTGFIVGECILVDVLPSLGFFDIGYGHMLHKVDDYSLLEKWEYPWVMSNAIRYEHPRKYIHPKGAVTWVRI